MAIHSYQHEQSPLQVKNLKSNVLKALAFKNQNKQLPSLIDPPQGNICVANKDNGEKCYNQRMPSSLYCKQHAH
jgi:hypothetical protein